jgi:hypothetical protein
MACLHLIAGGPPPTLRASPARHDDALMRAARFLEMVVTILAGVGLSAIALVSLACFAE